MRRKLAFVIFILFFASIACNIVFAGEIDNRLIVPGYRIGPIELGKPISPRVFKYFGKPTSYSAPDKGPKGKDTGSYYWEKAQIIVKINDGKADNNVFQIITSNPAFVTEKGVKIGSNFSAVKRFYPQGRKTEAMDMDFGWNIPGLSFGISQGKVTAIAIFPKR